MTRHTFLIIAVLFMLSVSGGRLYAQQDLIPYEDDEIASVEEEPVAEEEIPGPIEDYTVGWKKNSGLFTYYTDPETMRVLITLKPGQLDHAYFISSTLTKGTGDEMFPAPMSWGEDVFEFRRVGDSIEFVEPNYQITTVMGEPMARAVEMGISDIILGRTPIEVEDENDGRIAFDLGTFLMSANNIEIDAWYYGLSLMVDYEGSHVEEIKGFPLNDEIDTRVVLFGAGDAFGSIINNAQEIGLHYSLSEPPEPGYLPRLADDRLGYFLDMSLIYSVETDKAETRYQRYITRWRLEKADPDAELSEPVEPIVFWIENTVPYEYRDAVRDGILFWNRAFEQAGFKNAIRARQMPDDADWDPADIRYSTVRWFVSPQAMYSIGPSRTDPRTGEIYDADIGINADMMRSPFRDYELSVAPIRRSLEALFPPGWPNLNGRQVRWDEETYEILENQISPDGVGAMNDDFAAIHALEAARGIEILEMRNGFDPDSPEVQEYVHDYILSLVAHEVGHTLGLRHNFCGSAATSYWNLNRKSWTHQHGLSSSIMDYTSGNISPEGKPQGEYWQTTPGDYDRWVIEYGYIPIDAATPEDELDVLNDIAKRAPQFRYGTDEDVYGWSRNLDPDLYMWDLSDDTVRYYGDRLTASDQIIDRILEHWSDPGTRPPRIRLAFIYALWDYILASAAVPRAVGGVRAYRDHIGDPDAHPAFIPVSAEDQRRALEFLDTRIWSSESYRFDQELLNMLARDRSRTFDWYGLATGNRDFDIHQWVMMIQEEPLYWLYDSLVLERVLNNEMRMPDEAEVFTMVELFDTVRNSIWSELSAVAPIDSYRRNLQRAHLEMVSGIALNPAYGTPEDAVTLARRDLIILRDEISTLLASSNAENLDTMTTAHLDECLSRITLTLDAPITRGGGGGIILQF